MSKFISFRRKRDENQCEALERLNKKLVRLQFELSNWITVPTSYGILVTHRLEDNKQLLLKIKDILIDELNDRHQELLKLNPHTINI